MLTIGQDRNPFVLVLLDGDGMIVSLEKSCQGRQDPSSLLTKLRHFNDFSSKTTCFKRQSKEVETLRDCCSQPYGISSNESFRPCHPPIPGLWRAYMQTPRGWPRPATRLESSTHLPRLMISLADLPEASISSISLMSGAARIERTRSCPVSLNQKNQHIYNHNNILTNNLMT